ncbi:MAG: hypothetical protein AB7W28_09380, partial [Armatimonadota bacterium]
PIYFTGAFATLTGGIYWKGASRAGAYGAFLCGFMMVVGLKPVQDLLGVNWRGEYVGLTVTIGACVALVALSLLFPERKKEV